MLEYQNLKIYSESSFPTWSLMSLQLPKLPWFQDNNNKDKNRFMYVIRSILLYDNFGNDCSFCLNSKYAIQSIKPFEKYSNRVLK